MLGAFTNEELFATLHQRLDLMISRTPTGEKRELISEANIHLYEAESALKQANALRTGARS